jgi:calcium binding protein
MKAVWVQKIKGFSVDEKTAEAIADWHYWVAQGLAVLGNG